jgi:hypothetical protein
MPFAAITLLGSAGLVIGADTPSTRGYAFLSFLSASGYLIASLSCTVLHMVEGRRATLTPWRSVLPAVRGAILTTALQSAALVGATTWVVLNHLL